MWLNGQIHEVQAHSAERRVQTSRFAKYTDPDRENLSESELLYDWRFTANQSWRQSFETQTSNFIFQLNTCSYSPYIKSSQTRGWACVYNCCWSSPAQSFSGPNPAGLMTIFYCLKFETPPTWRARSPYLYPPGTEWPGYNPRHWVPFWSTPTTRRAKVEVFDPDFEWRMFIYVFKDQGMSVIDNVRSGCP
jgi:hypothetical protein